MMSLSSALLPLMGTFLCLDVFCKAEVGISCVVGEICVLSCRLQDVSDPVIVWTYLEGDAQVHSYSNGRDQLQKQDRRFTGRTSLFKEQIPTGNASLKLTAMKAEDQGRYKCKVGSSGQSERIVTLMSKENVFNKTVGSVVGAIFGTGVSGTFITYALLKFVLKKNVPSCPKISLPAGLRGIMGTWNQAATEQNSKSPSPV